MRIRLSLRLSCRPQIMPRLYPHIHPLATVVDCPLESHPLATVVKGPLDSSSGGRPKSIVSVCVVSSYHRLTYTDRDHKLLSTFTRVGRYVRKCLHPYISVINLLAVGQELVSPGSSDEALKL